MDVAMAQEYLRRNHRAVLATVRRDGRPQLSPVLVAVDDAGRVIVSTRETAVKVRNARRDPRVSVMAFPDEFFGGSVQVDGTAEIVELPAAMDLLVDYFRRISGEHPNWPEYRSAMERDGRVLLRFAIERAGPDVSG